MSSLLFSLSAISWLQMLAFTERHSGLQQLKSSEHSRDKVTLSTLSLVMGRCAKGKEVNPPRATSVKYV